MKDAINTEGKWEVLSSEHLFRRPWLTVRKDCVKLPTGQINDEFYVLEYPDWVNVIAITKDGDYVMERQYRHGLGVTCYEICAGVVEEGEPPLEAAKRELLEETGYAGGEWEEIMTVCGNSSTTNNYTHCFVARGVEKVAGQHLDRTEDIKVELLSREQVKELMDGNCLTQALMLAPLWRHFAGEIRRSGEVQYSEEIKFPDKEEG
ncbi:MAG: NUDIX hydrolase [Bacteroidales bacterium]|nr:NUDIX hydrolase [Bacteroidales bacterium]